MKRVVVFVFFIAFVTFCSHASATQQPEEILRAIIEIRSIIPEDARTAKFLGTERRGNGVVIDSNGHVLTIGYLILEAETIEIVLPQNEVVNAKFVAYDYHTGFGLLQAKTPIKVSPIKLGHSSEVNVGDPLLVAGHGGSDAVQGARVVSRQEFAGYWEYLLEDPIFTVPPYSNFGGSALINRDGRLVGIGSLFTQVMIQGLGSVPTNMFVPIDRLKPILGDLIAKGRSSEPPRPWLGLFSEQTHGRVIVTRVLSGSPAERAGLKRGDIILEVNQREVKGLADFYSKVWGLGKAGVDVPLGVLQGSLIRDIIVHSGDRYQFFRFQPK